MMKNHSDIQQSEPNYDNDEDADPHATKCLMSDIFPSPNLDDGKVDPDHDNGDNSDVRL